MQENTAIKRPPTKNFNNRKKSSRELARSLDSSRNNITLPPTKKIGYCIGANPHHRARLASSSSSSQASPSLQPSSSPSLPLPPSLLSDSEEDFKPTVGEKLYMPTRSGQPLDTNKNDNHAATLPNGGLRVHSKKRINPFPSTRLRIPAKKNKTGEDAEALSKLIKSLDKIKEDDGRVVEEDKIICPFCSESIFPITKPISRALKALEKRDDEFARKQKQRFEDMNGSSSFSRPVGFESKRIVPSEEKDKFCKLHRLELVIKPQGIKEGYPKEIDFEKLEPTIRTFDKELKDVIRRRVHSDYRKLAEEAYEEQGQAKARSTMSLLSRFTATLPGYYGPKGAAFILKTLTKMYLDTGYLEDHLVSAQLPLEFLQQVMIPEVGYRLIRRDLSINGLKPNLSEKAKRVMKESTAYGNAMFPADDAQIDKSEDDDLLQIELYNIDSD
ncbi:hypothetical protein [Parasitella parasitica]|uniref:Restriction of telomere capping protein 4 n=1 Tax=Parasitella parasitica TaxID=35722 RepID=A0A0B7NVG3_9FUNG|nr:hypothetical protein [Parasitella parasitica]